jgi:hypothetical protein
VAMVWSRIFTLGDRSLATAGHGKLMLHRPGDAYSVGLFWDGSDDGIAALNAA